MLPTLLIISLNLLVLSLIGLGWSLIAKRRQKLRLYASLEALVDNFNALETERSRYLLSCLNQPNPNGHPTSSEDAVKLMLKAESKFISQFIEQQMQNSVSDLYESMADLLDSYLNICRQYEPTSPDPTTENVNLEKPLAETPVETIPIDEETNPFKNQEIEPEPVPDWGDVFD